jgi:hypothetical protein
MWWRLAAQRCRNSSLFTLFRSAPAKDGFPSGIHIVFDGVRYNLTQKPGRDATGLLHEELGTLDDS